MPNPLLPLVAFRDLLADPLPPQTGYVVPGWPLKRKKLGFSQLIRSSYLKCILTMALQFQLFETPKDVFSTLWQDGWLENFWPFRALGIFATYTSY